MSTFYANYPVEGGNSGVSSLNSLTGSLTLVGGTGITITPSGTNITITSTSQPAGNYITALTGDGTASGPGSVALTLATVNSNVGSFGSSTAIPSFTVNAKGLITAASTSVVVAPAGTLTGTMLASNVVSSSLTSVGTIGTGVWQGSVIQPSYIATLNQNTTGTAANITATSNSTLTTLSSLSLPYSQLTGTPSLSGYVTSVSIASANGFAGSSSGGQTPALTLSTSITGLLKGNGTSISAAVSGTDYVVPSGSITGTASNITGTSNSTLTTLSALSLPGSQVSGNISGNSTNITATSNSTITTLSSLSLPTSQLSGNIGLTTQVTGVLPIANGGTDNGSLSVAAGGLIYTDGTKFQNVGAGTSGYILQSNGSSAPTWVNSAFAAPTVFSARSPTGTPPSTLTKIVYPTVDFDSASAYNATTGIYTIPTTGYYRIHASLSIDGTLSTSADVVTQIYKNGSSVAFQESYASGNNTGGLTGNVHCLLSCTAGDTIAVYASINATSPSYYQDSLGGSLFDINLVK